MSSNPHIPAAPTSAPASAAQSAPSIYSAYSGNTYLFGGNAPYVEEMYENYLANPGSVLPTWREYFDALQHVPAVDGTDAKDVPHLPVVNAFAERAKSGQTKVVVASADLEMGRKRTAAQQLIAAYRNVGARWADLDPLKRSGIDTLVLGCTHFPLLASAIRSVTGSRVELISSAAETAREVAETLARRDHLAPAGSIPTREFITTGDAEEFERLGSRVLGHGTGPVESLTIADLEALAAPWLAARAEDIANEGASCA